MTKKNVEKILLMVLTISSLNMYAVGKEDEYKNDCTPMNFFSFARFAHKINSYDWRFSFYKAEGKFSAVNDGKVVNHSFTKKKMGLLLKGEKRENSIKMECLQQVIFIKRTQNNNLMMKEKLLVQMINRP